MSALFHKTKERIVYFLGISVLSKVFLSFIMSHFFYVIFTNFQGSFINTLFQKASGETSVALKYNLIFYACIGFIMCLAAVVTRKFSSKLTFQLGIILYLFSTLLFLLFLKNNNVTQFFWVFSIINSFAAAFYWISYALCLTEYSSDSSRDVALSFVGLITGLVTLIVPFISGTLISSFDGYTGYFIMFTIAFIVGVVNFIFASRLPLTKSPKESSKFIQTFKLLSTDKRWIYGMLGETLKGTREGAFLFYLNVLLYQIVKSEFLVGFNILLAGVVSMLSFWVAGKFMRPNNRIKYMLIAVCFLFVVTCGLYLKLDPTTIIIFSVLNSFCAVFTAIPPTNTFYMIMDKIPEGKECKSELVAIKEIFLCAGRVAGIATILLTPKTPISIVSVILILTAVQFATVAVCNKTVRLMNNT